MIVTIVFMMSLLCGCDGESTIEKNGEQSDRLTEEFYAMAAEFQNIILPCDQMADVYRQTLKELHDYMEDRSEESRKETLNVVQKAKETIKNQEIPEYMMSQEVQAFLKERGIPETEFLAIAEKRTTDQQDYLKHMEIYEQNLSEFIVTVGVIPMSLKVTVDYQDKMHQCEQMWMSYATNEVFLCLEKEELDYMKEIVFSKWKFYFPEEMEWQEQASYALQKQEEYWNREVDLMSKMTAIVGELTNQEYGDEYGYVVDLDGNIGIIRYLGESTKTEIPDMIQDYPVTTIHSGAFSGTNIKEITIPVTVENMGTDIFAGCSDVTIYGENGSAAENYAKEVGIPFKVKGDL